MNDKYLRESANIILDAALNAVDPYHLIYKQVKRDNNVLSFQSEYEIDISQFKNIYLLGIGKGVAPMAQAMAELLNDELHSGEIIVKYEHGQQIDKINVHEAAHPIPDNNTLTFLRASHYIEFCPWNLPHYSGTISNGSLPPDDFSPHGNDPYSLG